MSEKLIQPPINSFFNTRKRCASDLLCAPASKKLLLVTDGDSLKVAAEVKNEGKGKITPAGVERVENDKKVEDNLKKTTARRTVVVASRKRTLPGCQEESTKKSVDLTMKQIQEKVMQSKKLPVLKEQLLKLKELEKKRQMLMKQNKTPTKVEEKMPEEEEGQSLKKFDKLDLEVFTSPSKAFKSPIKMRTPTPKKPDSELMSPRKASSAVKTLFSPEKEASAQPAYEKYAHLVEKTPGLQLPSEYRKLLEIFKGCETACYLIKGEITWKKLKPQVTLACRKIFNESHLAQIRTIFPEAYSFAQKKTHNYGSVTKGAYYQLVIKPNVDQYSAHLMTRRQEIFRSRLENLVRVEHEKFLLESLKPPMVIPREKITRWHPEFDLEACPKIQEAEMPRPENEEKFSVAKDVLSGVAKRLFIQEQQPVAEEESPKIIPESPVSELLKRVPASLVEKIRAKQAERAKREMTRRPSQEAEALAYSRLPDLASKILNMCLPEKKFCNPMEKVLDTLANSFRENLPRHEFQRLIGILAQEVPEWLSIPELRKEKYVKLQRNINFQGVIYPKLKHLATEKSA